jgi:hypothetical protein
MRGYEYDLDTPMLLPAVPDVNRDFRGAATSVSLDILMENGMMTMMSQRVISTP